MVGTWDMSMKSSNIMSTCSKLDFCVSGQEQKNINAEKEVESVNLLNERVSEIK